MKTILIIAILLILSGCSSEKKFTVKVFDTPYDQKTSSNHYKVSYKITKPDGSIINKKINQCCSFSEDLYGKEIECSVEGYNLTLELWINDDLQNTEFINSGETKISYK